MIDPAGLLTEATVERPAPDALTIRRVFTVQPAVLWRMFTDPAHFVRWWGGPTAGCTACTLDLRVGGRWRSDLADPATGQTYVIHGEYLRIVPPTELAFTWSFGDPGTPGAAVSEVTLHFAARGRGSELALFHRRLPPEAAESHEKGWLGALSSLARHVAAQAPQEGD